MNKLKNVLITGHRKCGTTLLLNLLDNHPKLSCYPWDICVLYAYYPHFIKKEQNVSKLKERLFKIICEHFEFKVKKFKLNLDSKVFTNNFLNNLDKIDVLNIKSVVNTLKKTWIDFAGDEIKSKFIFKETSADIYSSDLFAWFTDLQIIQIIRDPRDNFSSLKSGVDKYYSKLGESEFETLTSMINRAKLDMEMAIYNQKKYGTEKYMIIRYEDLVDDTYTVMRNISNFLNIEFSSSMIKPTVFGAITNGNNFDKINLSSVSNINANNWKNRILDEEAKIIEYNFKHLMDYFNYEICFTLDEQVLSQSNYYKWLNYRYFYHDRFNRGINR